MNQVTTPAWRRSSHCTAGTCVEVAKVADAYLIRDSKNPTGAELSFTEDEWTAFTTGVNAGEFRF